MPPPIVFQIEWNTPVEPVKWTPASSGLASAVSPSSAPGPKTRLITPGGRPASSRMRSVYQAESACVDAGFQTTVLPMSAGEVVRLAPIAVKLNGLTAKTNPSSARYSRRFQTPGEEIGCSS